MSTFKQDLDIDELNLTDEFVKQPSLYLQYQESLQEKETERASFKLELEVLESMLDKEYRDVEGKKPTEAQIKNAIIADVKRIAKYKEYLKLNESTNILKAVVSSLDHKKKSLEKLADLWIAGYYSTPREKSDIKHDRQKRGLNKDK